MACGVLHTHCSLFLIAAQQVKTIALSCLFTTASVILQLPCDLRYLQNDRMISEQKDVPKIIPELCSEG